MHARGLSWTLRETLRSLTLSFLARCCFVFFFLSWLLQTHQVQVRAFFANEIVSLFKMAGQEKVNASMLRKKI